MTRFVLASSSPRRRELLASAGIEFDVVPSDIPEVHRAGEGPAAYVGRLAAEKAAAVGTRHRDRWIIAADTTVFIDGVILEKPADAADARRMLGLIAGRTHSVYTGLTLSHAERDRSMTEVTCSRVTMSPLTPEQIARYVETGEPLDKAGAYAVQGVGALFIDSIDGSYSNVVGLPLATLYRMLRAAGLDPLAVEK